MSKKLKRSKRRAPALSPEQADRVVQLWEKGSYDMKMIARKLGFTYRQARYAISKHKAVYHPKEEKEPDGATAAVIMKALDMAEIDSYLSDYAKLSWEIVMALPRDKETLVKLGPAIDRMIDVRKTLMMADIPNPNATSDLDFDKISALVELIPEEKKEAFAAYLKEIYKQ